MDNRAISASMRRRSLAPTLLVIGALFLLTWLTVTRSSMPVLAHDSGLQLVLSSLAASSLALGAFVFWCRAVAGGTWSDLLNGSGLAVLAGANGAIVAAGLQAGGAGHGASLAAVWGCGEVIAASAFVLARRLHPRAPPTPLQAVAVGFVAPAVLIWAAVIAA